MVASVVVFGLVVAALLFVLVRFRSGRPGEASRRSGHRRLEAAWTTAALLLIGGLFVAALRTMAQVEAVSADAPLVVEVIGHQWWWELRYPGAVRTANELHLPVGRPVEFRIASVDVIHSFWVPALGWKRDAVPGRSNTMRVLLDRGGTFDGACAEYCGLQHAWMRVRLVAEESAAFEAWLRNESGPAPDAQSDAARRGLALFRAGTCVSCHAIRGAGADATVGPDLSHLAARTTLGAGALDNMPESLRAWIADPHQAKPGVLMPAFANLRESELRDLAAYLGELR
jgi:cytochrome c oxidase subunit 2